MDFNKLVIPADKANHFVYGSVLYSIGFVAALPFTGPAGARAAGLGLCAVFAVGKEIYDKKTKKGTPDPWDTFATLSGGLNSAATTLAIF